MVQMEQMEQLDRLLLDFGFQAHKELTVPQVLVVKVAVAVAVVPVKEEHFV